MANRETDEHRARLLAHDRDEESFHSHRWQSPQSLCRQSSSFAGILLLIVATAMFISATISVLSPNSLRHDSHSLEHEDQHDRAHEHHDEFCPQPTSPCSKPVNRREWRSLTISERKEFIDAFQCMSKLPGNWLFNGTLYDDWAHLHGGIGSWSHRSASFLPWHRYTLFMWERTLKESCDFHSPIPYWDWTLDWQNLASSSIWDAETGFGGDGTRGEQTTVGGGSCVEDGPFRNLRPKLYNHTYLEHCLSRGFNDMMRRPVKALSPESMGAIMRNTTYAGFEKRVEFTLHNGLHEAIGGDFKALTAANDPIFFLHHAQVDRLWWRWQREDPAARLYQYGGSGLRHMFNSRGPSTIEDKLVSGGLLPDVKVKEVMDTEGDMLCYRYS
ncbi:tyrosinase-like protein [Colletotrichum tofieldiae]|nr:tyrosinase-like protein [Colletotrichum tofieldiae]